MTTAITQTKDLSTADHPSVRSIQYCAERATFLYEMRFGSDRPYLCTLPVYFLTEESESIVRTDALEAHTIDALLVGLNAFAQQCRNDAQRAIGSYSRDKILSIAGSAEAVAREIHRNERPRRMLS